MAGTKTFVNFNSKEQAITPDVARVGRLASRELQDTAQWAGAKGDQGSMLSVFDTGPAPMAGLLRPGTIYGLAGTFTVAVGAGEGFLPGSSADADISAYDVVRWDNQNLAWPAEANPDSSYDRICLIVARPANVLGDPQSRNILVNPSPRTISPQTVYKTSDPLATLSVVAGTPSSQPQPPSVPSGALALWAVYVPAGAGSPDSRAFGFVRRCQRRLEFPGTTQHGILQGCVPQWAITDESTSNIPALSLDDVHRVIIDGELLSFAGCRLAAQEDTSYGVGTAADHDVPYYMYLVGGRSAPQVVPSSAYPKCSPVRLVETSIYPDAWGRPVAPLHVNGVTVPIAAAVYIGVGFIVKNTFLRKGCRIDGDWVHAMSTRIDDVTSPSAGFNQANLSLTPSVGQDCAINTIPNPSTMLDIEASVFENAYYGGPYSLYLEAPGGSLTLRVAFGNVQNTGSGGYVKLQGRCPVTAGGLYFLDQDNLGSTLTALVHARAYNMNLPRLSR